jgi:hypothetical protein
MQQYLSSLWKRTHSRRSHPLVGAHLSQLVRKFQRGAVTWRERRLRGFSKEKRPHPVAINRLIDCPYATHLSRVRGSWEDWARGKEEHSA